MLTLSPQPKLSAQGPLRPGFITSLSPTMCLIDGTSTPVEVIAGAPYAPTVGDRVGLMQFGGGYLAFPVQVAGDGLSPSLLKPLARGTVARNNRATSTSTTTTTAVMALTTTAQLYSDRNYRVWHSAVLVESSVSADWVQTRMLMSAAGGSVTTSSTLLTLATAVVPVANNADATISNLVDLPAPASGIYQFGVAYLRQRGTGNVYLNLAAGRSLDLVVEDIGPAIPAGA